MGLSEEKKIFWDRQAETREMWRAKNQYYYDEMENFIESVVCTDGSVLEIGSGLGHLLAKLSPQKGTGIDFSSQMVKRAKEKYPQFRFFCDDIETLEHAEKYNLIIMSNLVGELIDVWSAFRNLRKLCREGSKVIIVYYNYLWEPLIALARKWKWMTPTSKQNWLSLKDLDNLLQLNGFEAVKKGYRILFPFRIPLVSFLLNRLIAKLPLFRKLCLMNYVIARPLSDRVEISGSKQLSCSVIVPCRNEKGNIENAVRRIPNMGERTEIIFVDGASTDGSVEEIKRVQEKFRNEKNIRLIHQLPSEEIAQHFAQKEDRGKMLSLGKGHAVRLGFEAASGDVLMILDADLTVPPEDLPKFYAAIAENRGELINGTRLVYPLEKEAMRLLNILANKIFSMIFTWLLEQPVKDTLCGTKVLLARDYGHIAANRHFFGDFDPFGDFDLLLGASKLNLKIREVPIRYVPREYGNIKIERFKHGLLLLKMSWIAFRKLKLRS
jgi:glycosyltransferase involved in cell wall biosynthesis/SAM-dependent methyltransferase